MVDEPRQGLQPLALELYPSQPTLLTGNREGCLLLPIDERRFPTIPAFYEALSVVPMPTALRLGRVDPMVLSVAHTLILCHRRGVPAIHYYLDHNAYPSLVADRPRFLQVDCTSWKAASGDLMPILGLWGMDFFLDCPGHRRNLIDEKTATIYTADRVYQVQAPSNLPKADALFYTPAIFAQLSLSAAMEDDSDAILPPLPPLPHYMVDDSADGEFAIFMKPVAPDSLPASPQ